MHQCIVDERSSDVTVRLAVVYKRVCMQAGCLVFGGTFQQHPLRLIYSYLFTFSKIQPKW